MSAEAARDFVVVVLFLRQRNQQCPFQPRFNFIPSLVK